MSLAGRESSDGGVGCGAHGRCVGLDHSFRYGVGVGEGGIELFMMG